MLLAATGRLTIGTGVAGIHARSPIAMAQTHRAVTEAYGNVFVLGVRISHPWLATELHGAEFGPRVYVIGTPKPNCRSSNGETWPVCSTACPKYC